MILTGLILTSFRSHQSLEFIPNSHTNLILGKNGSGKTNILEAIHVLATGKSFLPHTLGELISWGANHAFIRGKIEGIDRSETLEVQLISNLQKSASRRLLIDNLEKTRPKYIGRLKVVIFQPEDLRIVNGSPTRRRDYFDSIFCATTWTYASALRSYQKAIRHRNELLDLIFQNQASSTELFYWDQSLLKNGQIIQDFRSKFVNFVNQFFSSNSHSEINKMQIRYIPSILNSATLENSHQIDLRRGATQVGPHRDDFEFHSQVFKTSDTNLLHWGSRGQQRLAILALKLAEIEYIKSTFNQKPVLLLDDIFSELDQEHRGLVIDLCKHYQTVFTSAEDVVAKLLPSATITHV